MSTNDMTDDDSEQTIERGKVSVTGGLDLTDHPGTSFFTPGKHGQTVGGSSRDDVEAGEMTTTNVPDPDDLPECLGGVKVESILSEDELDQWREMTTKRKRTAVVTALYPDESKAQIGEIADTSPTMVRQVGLERADIVRSLAEEFHDGEPPSDQHWREADLPFDELSDQRQAGIDAVALFPDRDREEQASAAGVSGPTIKTAARAYDNLVHERREAFHRGEAQTVIEGVDATDLGYPDPDAEDDDEMAGQTTDEAEDAQEADHSDAAVAEGDGALTIQTPQDGAQERVEDAIFAARFIERTHDDVAGEVAAELRRILEGESEVQR